MNKTISRLLIIIVLQVFVIHCLCAQKIKVQQIEIVNANTFEYDESIGNQAKRLIGDVVFKHENVFMYCDSAYFYSSINSLDAFGNVHIKQGDSINAWGKQLNYNGNKKYAVLTNNVKLTDGDMTLTTPELFYDMDKNIAHYNSGGKIINKDNTLTSNLGYYYSNTKDLYFKKNVVLVNPKYTMTTDTLKYNTISKTAYFLSPTRIKGEDNFIYCENGWYDTKNDKAEIYQNSYLENNEKRIKGDYLYYDRKLSFGKAQKNVTLTDTAQKISVSGTYGEFYEKQGRSYVTGKALLTQQFGNDTLYLHADTLLAINDTIAKTKTLFAYNHTKFYMDEMQGLADSLVYCYSDSTIKLFKTPVLWNNKNQITADTLVIEMENGKFKKLTALQNSFIIEQLNDTSKYNQIKGNKMIGFFNENNLKKLDVFTNAQTIYYPQDSKKNDYIGLNRSTAQDLRIVFNNDGEVHQITFIKEPNAVLIPIKDIQANDTKLEDFWWLNSYRPTTWQDVLNWQPITKIQTN